MGDQRPERFEVKLFGGASWHDLMMSSATDTGGIVVETMSMDLLYYVTAEEMAAEEGAEARANEAEAAGAEGAPNTAGAVHEEWAATD